MGIITKPPRNEGDVFYNNPKWNIIKLIIMDMVTAIAGTNDHKGTKLLIVYHISASNTLVTYSGTHMLPSHALLPCNGRPENHMAIGSWMLPYSPILFVKMMPASKSCAIGDSMNSEMVIRLSRYSSDQLPML